MNAKPSTIALDINISISELISRWDVQSPGSYFLEPVATCGTRPHYTICGDYYAK